MAERQRLRLAARASIFGLATIAARSARTALRYVGWLCAGTALFSAGAMAQGKAQTVSVPPNYRAVIAKHMLASGLPKSQLDTARISGPFAMRTSIFNPEPMPAVCIVIQGKNIFGSKFARLHLIAMFKGRATAVAVRNADVEIKRCPPFTPFFEVMTK